MVLTRGKNPGNTDGDEQDPDTVDGEANDDDIEPLEAELVPERSSSRIRERSLDEKPNSRSFRSDTSEKNRGTPSSAGSAKSQNAIQSTSTSAQTKSGHFILNLAAEDTPLSQRWSASKKKGKRLTLFSGDSTSSRTKQRSSNNIDDPIYDSSDEERAEVKSASRPSRNRRHRQTNCDEVVKHEESYDGMEHDVKKLRPTRRRWQSDIDEQVVKEEENSYDEVETGVKKTRPTRSCSQWRRNIYEPEEKEEENSCDEIELAVRNTRPTRSRRQCQQDIEEHEGKHDENSRDEIEPNKKSRPTRNRQQWPNYADEQVEKQDEHSMDCTGGVRRSTRNRKPMYGSFQVSSHNSSWLFGYQPVKGYPKDQEEEEDGKQRRSARIRMLQREDVIDEEDDAINSEREEEEEESRGAGDNDFGTMEPMTTRSRRVIKKAVPYNDDMYSRVKRMPRAANHYKNYRATTMSSAKRTRQPPRRNRFTNMPSTDESSMELDSGSENEAEADEANAEGQKNKEGSNENGEVLNNNEDGRRVKGKYLLRRIQPSIDRFQPHAMDTKQSSRSNTPPPRLRSSSNRRAARMICSPAHRTLRKRRQRAQNASSTSSSSSDDERFERRKNKSMVKARNRCLPMNFNPDDLSQGVIKDRMKIGSSLADVDPMTVDRSVTFEQVGGLDTYIRSLKEMILFPLLYPEVFQKFGIQPPRGVLFYGPPGTGKTLVARALANECSQKDRRVAFFMRKGADCLSKWVGESERQLRLLFDQAYQMRPSIIFFDEIDGLAPVRSTRQDQIHSSIVSTLLALMDGLDSRGEVIIIGATNRLDAIDPALRRPGRFDREFHFPLPSHAARKEILGIHLKSWNPPPGANLINYLSEKTVGYCGADLKALCAEAALLALRRRYPQVYSSKDKLLLDLSQISVDRRDFVQALQRLVPASQRSSPGAGKPLSEILVPLLSGSLQALIQHTQKVFPQGMAVLKVKGPLGGAKKLSANQFSPRLLVSGESCTHLASALLHHLERLPVHRLDLTSLYGLSVRNPEEACVQLFQEARRNVPSIIYLPQVGRWWPAVSETVRATFMSLLNELEPELPILLLVTHDGDADQCSEDVAELFDEDDDEIFRTRPFSEQERRKFFFPVLMEKALKAPPTKKKSNVQLEVLPVAPPPPPRDLSEREKARLERKEEATLRELRIFLREILAKLARNKLFFYFTQPVDVREVSDYLDIIQTPMDLETMMTKIDQHCYESAKDFLADIELIWSNALEYNPYHTSQGKLIRHRACTLRDTAYALIKAEMDTDFEEQCQEISRNRKARHVEANPTAEPAPVAPSDDMAAAQNGAAEVADNAEKQDADVSASRKRRKVSAWSRGNSNRRAKKGKADADHSSGNVSASGNNSANGDASANATYSANENTNDNIEPEDDYVTTGEMAADVDAAPIQTEESEEKPDVDLVDLIVHHEPDQVVEVSTVVEDSVLDESHYSEAADAVEDASPVAIQVPCSTTPCNLPTKVVKVDTDHLEQLLDLAVCRTADFSLERMLRLYSKLNRLIVRYSRVWDRTALVQDLETVVKRATDREV